MKLIIFGLTMSSSWGNGHATLWRGLCRAMIRRGHELVFFEKNVPYYEAHRDQKEFPGMSLEIYSDWETILPKVKGHLKDADVGMVTSYCPDARGATELLLDSPVRVRSFYDLDAPVTLERVSRGERVEYLPDQGLSGFDLVLSYTGGHAIESLKQRLGAKNVAPLYGSVDPALHARTAKKREFAADLSYLGTYAEDRQATLEELFLEPARRLGEKRFFLSGSMYPRNFPWRENIFHRDHLPPSEHSAFYSSSRLTLSITRKAMARMGHCPSGRLFEAAACGVPILSDAWEGIEEFFAPGSEILIARGTSEVLEAMALPDSELFRISRAARDRALECHTAERRALELEQVLESSLDAAGDELCAQPVKTKKRTAEMILSSKECIWGIVPAAGAGSRFQPLAFSKELLPVGSRIESGVERPRAVSEFLVERMIRGGASRICFVISPGKSDILEYYGGNIQATHLCYAVQPRPLGLCDAIFRATHLIRGEDQVLVGLPDTIWFPEDGFRALSGQYLSFLLFPVKHPEAFDAVATDASGRVLEIEVKKDKPRTNWVWGAIRMPGYVIHELHLLWRERGERDEYLGTLVNEYIRRGAEVRAVPSGDAYVDVGTLHGYREAIQVLSERGAELGD